MAKVNRSSHTRKAEKPSIVETDKDRETDGGRRFRTGTRDALIKAGIVRPEDLPGRENSSLRFIFDHSRGLEIVGRSARVLDPKDIKQIRAAIRPRSALFTAISCDDPALSRSHEAELGLTQNKAEPTSTYIEEALLEAACDSSSLIEAALKYVDERGTLAGTELIVVRTLLVEANKRLCAPISQEAG